MASVNDTFPLKIIYELVLTILFKPVIIAFFLLMPYIFLKSFSEIPILHGAA
ncbi:hypothetical protein CPB83DRAFT_857508 [Crepidotus variabilis]|uniref:Uncharacterized protein n=1 Tax=Crepidotus variabilis TaxID=179855 RepID=A0A9P6ECP2_9AGAR|nr:hypothetical protein CPB83DRAFT_857508 [Crepidotus variabilis]